MQPYWKYWRISILLLPLLFLALLVGLDVSQYLQREARQLAVGIVDIEREWKVASEAKNLPELKSINDRLEKVMEEFRRLRAQGLACNWVLFALTIPLAWVTWQLTRERLSQLEMAGRFASILLPLLSVILMLMPDPGQRWLVVQVLAMLLWLGVTAALQKVAVYRMDQSLLEAYAKMAKIINILVIAMLAVRFFPQMIPPAAVPTVIWGFWIAQYVIVFVLAQFCWKLAQALSPVESGQLPLLSPAEQTLLIREFERQSVDKEHETDPGYEEDDGEPSQIPRGGRNSRINDL